MANLKTYLTQDGESVFDLAVKLFGRADSLQSLLIQFPDLNSGPTLNSVVEYVPIEADTTNSKSVPITRTLTSIYKTRDPQSIYDLAVQLYGDVSKIGILLDLFPNLDSAINLNSEISLETQIDPIAVFFKDNQIIVATDRSVVYEEGLRITDLGFRIIHTGDSRSVRVIV